MLQNSIFPTIAAGSKPDCENFNQETRPLIIVGCLVLGSFISLLMAWSFFVPLSSAAIAPGVVSVEGYSKKIQHLEGGIIRALHVKDGDKVKKGQILIKIDDTKAKAEYDSLKSQLVLVATRHARLTAEQQNQDTISFPDWIISEQHEPAIEKVISEQNQSFVSRRNEQQQQFTIIGNRIQRSKNQLRQLKGSLSAQKKQLFIARDELKLNQKFLKKGLITRRDLFKLQSTEANIEVEIKEKQAQLSSINQQIEQLELQKTDSIVSRNADISNQLQEDKELLVKLTHQLSKTKDTLSRTTITAPVAGTIVNLQVHTIGGVITAGQQILDIVPVGQKLLVDAHVEPKDRDIIQLSQPAEVRFTAFNQRTLRPIKGKVKMISADRLTDQTTQLPYYLATIELTEDPVKALNNTPVYPGMQATVMIVTGERTAMDYLIQPVLRRFTKAFRED